MEERMHRDQCMRERPARQMLDGTTRVSKHVMGQAVGRRGGWEQQGLHHDDVIDSLNVSPITAPRGAHTLSAEGFYADPVHRMPPCIRSVPHLVSSFMSIMLCVCVCVGRRGSADLTQCLLLAAVMTMVLFAFIALFEMHRR
jgi:hypothetical protein